MTPKLSNRARDFAPRKTRFSPSLRAFFARCTDAIYPPRCAGCNIFCQSIFCAPCRDTLQIAPAIRRAREPREYSLVVPEIAAATLSCRAAFLFDGALREAVHRFKYEGKTALAAPLSQLMLESFGSESENFDASTRAPTGKNAAPKMHEKSGDEKSGGEKTGDEEASRCAHAAASTRALFGANSARENLPIFVPVPLHSWRKWRRGYNQSELLARELSHLTGAPHLPLLRRARYTTTQTELTREERLQNVEGAFALDEKAARVLAQSQNARTQNASPQEPLSFVLVDDVYTTGATLEECARVLRGAFPNAKIRAVTLAGEPPQ